GGNTMTETTNTLATQPTNTAAEAEVTGYAMDAFLKIDGIKGENTAKVARPGLLPTVSAFKPFLSSPEYRR
ncbi:MAG: hypothetical protein ACYDCQ_05210, partial [Dehalococcoidia bacterium]